MRGKQPIVLSEDAKDRALASIKRYFLEDMEQEIGDLKAELLFDFFVREIGPTVYNHAVTDARAFFEERTADLEGICYQVEFPYWPKRR
ncbi:MAG: hypothetical protein AMS21_11650 [Gemmatimonas sp. SG8_38_2]|nr:MAG: hypothetical protein AMS21_11650 [Gemmatimonas sp. SG8_38_2]